ncbi:hypothetical protein K1W54_22560 [Micromonospora sp. CPCC 205371]|nr:hypothetical protein [Micromonospora sp. CPCC 205371]
MSEHAGFGMATLAHRRFAGGERRIDDAFSARHFTDLTRGHELSYRPELTSPAGNPFASMTAALHAEVCADGAGVELGVGAHATPGLGCPVATSTYLASALPEVRLSFAVSENGSCAPYTALRLARLYAARHGFHRVLVLVLDQATIPYEVRLPADLRPAGDAAVALLLTTDGTGAPVEVGQRAGVSPARVPETVRELVSAMGTPLARLRLVDGAGLSPGWWTGAVGPVAETRTAPAGYRATATWGELAAAWSGDETLATVLVDYDRITADLGVCVIGPRAGTA